MCNDTRHENAILSQQVTAIQKELVVIAEQNKVLAHDKWVLDQEKAQLFGQI